MARNTPSTPRLGNHIDFRAVGGDSEVDPTVFSLQFPFLSRGYHRFTMSSGHDDQYSGMRPLIAVVDPNESFFQCSLTLKQIQKELKKLTDQAHQGIDIDESRFDYLLRAQEHNEEYKLLMAEERLAWRDSVYEFAEQCLERTRSFVPVNVFESSLESLTAIGLSVELAKRILQRQCLWLVRMSKAEIASLHESDLLGRFNSSAQHMDIIETAAIYLALPDSFNGDELGKKRDWRDIIEENLRRMLQDNDNDQLPEGRIRHPAYAGLQFGPIEDVTSVRETNIVSGRHSHRPRRSFLEVCKTHSILSSVNVKAAPDDSDSSGSERGEGFEDEYEEGGEDEEVYQLEEGSTKMMEGIKPGGYTSSYVSRDVIEDSSDDEEREGYGKFGAEDAEEDGGAVGDADAAGESGDEPDVAPKPEAADEEPEGPFGDDHSAEEDPSDDNNVDQLADDTSAQDGVQADDQNEDEDAHEAEDQHHATGADQEGHDGDAADIDGDDKEVADANFHAYIDQLKVQAYAEGSPQKSAHGVEHSSNNAEHDVEHGHDSGRDSGEYFLVGEGFEAVEAHPLPTPVKAARRRSTLRPHDPNEPGEHEYVDAHTFSETDTDDDGSGDEAP